MNPYIKYEITHTSLRLEMVKVGSRSRFIFAEKPFVVEAAAKEYLISQGWWVVRGEEISVFFAMLSANFGGSFFADVCKNYVGDEATALMAQIKNLCEASIHNGILSEEHINLSVSFMCKYYKSEAGHRRAKLYGKKVAELSPTHQLALLGLYRDVGYFTKGIPDLFATKDSEFVFYEVKSEGDSLRPEQYVFAEALLPRLPGSFQVVRVLGEKGGHLHLLSNPADRACK